ECGGMLARVIQHELDHLEGIVFVERAEEESYSKIRNAVEKQIKKNGFRNFKVRRRV
ncbi:MAG: peptide deformylase, partial [Lentisphaeria bacterium]|nr:peptide deformylase [Lentisphaeria bacterium]